MSQVILTQSIRFRSTEYAADAVIDVAQADAEQLITSGQALPFTPPPVKSTTSQKGKNHE
jgi:hypothetical protein